MRLGKHRAPWAVAAALLGGAAVRRTWLYFEECRLVDRPGDSSVPRAWRNGCLSSAATASVRALATDAPRFGCGSPVVGVGEGGGRCRILANRESGHGLARGPLHLLTSDSDDLDCRYADR